MKLVPCDLKDVGYYKKTKNFELLTEFASSEYDCVMVKEYDHKNVDNCVNSLRGSIRKFKMDNIIVIQRNGCVFLAKKSAMG